MVDDKPLPYEITATETTRGHFNDPPLWRKAYLGHYYGLASQDIKGGSVDVIGQWNPRPEAATDADQLGTLTLRYNINDPNMTRTQGGKIPYSGGTLTFQDRNRAIVATKPRTDRASTYDIVEDAGQEGVRALFTTIALWHFRDPSDWELYVDGERVTDFPFNLQAGQLITVKDGPVYVGIIPLPATDLGRDREVVIEPAEPTPLGEHRNEGVSIAPALLINSYNLKQDEPIDEEGEHWEQITKEAYGGFVIEMGDVEAYSNFESFQRHMASNQVDTEWQADERLLHIAYRSGEDLMEMGVGTDYEQAEAHFAVEPGQHRRAIPYRRINGEQPYLPEGIDRDTTLTQQGTTGRLEKNGAVLEMEAGRKMYLQTEPVSGTYTGYNPIPELSTWSLAVPGEVEVRADGRLGIARISVRPLEGKLWIDQAYKPGQRDEADVAERLLVFGLDEVPEVVLNGATLDEPLLEALEIDGRQAWAIPLDLE
ncbi:MAG: hypothetical protein WD534_08670 [Phycisphaeraceae bacterium]